MSDFTTAESRLSNHKQMDKWPFMNKCIYKFLMGPHYQPPVPVQEDAGVTVY